MSGAPFVHLRTHSAFSLSQSTLRIGTLCDLASNDKQVALAITDSFNMFGALEFSKKTADKGIQPIIGAMVNIKDQYGTGEVVLLAQDEDGYVNLSYLISDALMAAEGGEDAAGLSKQPSVRCSSFADVDAGQAAVPAARGVEG